MVGALRGAGCDAQPDWGEDDVLVVPRGHNLHQEVVQVAGADADQVVDHGLPEEDGEDEQDPREVDAQ